MDSADFWTIIISSISLIVSIYVLWVSHLSKFKLLISHGVPSFTVYRVDNENPDEHNPEMWYMPSIDMPFCFINRGAIPGEVKDMRIVLKSVREEFTKTNTYEETFKPTWCVKFEEYNKAQSDRSDWLKNSIENEWFPFYILRGISVNKHIVFESFRWVEEFPKGKFNISLEILTTESKEWRRLKEYSFTMSDFTISQLQLGSSFALPEKEENDAS